MNSLTTDVARLPDPAEVSSRVIAWFDPQRRFLPWRDVRTPYSVWVSEVMLQQTTVPFVAKRFTGWMERFPSIQALAEAETSEVLAAWEGIGYYRRATNLHNAAHQIVENYNGELPDSYLALRSLPGIGDYTASAILAIAFDKPSPAIDVNMRRILGRLTSGAEVQGVSESIIRDFLVHMLDGSSPAILTEALMELGQTLCTVRAPLCAACPLESLCPGPGGAVGQRDSRVAALEIHKRSEVAILANEGDSMLMTFGSGRLFAGMSLFPTTPLKEDWRRTAEEWCSQRNLKPTGMRSLQKVTHHYTVNQVRLTPVYIEIESPAGSVEEDLKWLSRGELHRLPMPSAHRKIFEILVKAKP